MHNVPIAPDTGNFGLVSEDRRFGSFKKIIVRNLTRL
jgi:hypothetical protein